MTWTRWKTVGAIVVAMGVVASGSEAVAQESGEAKVAPARDRAAISAALDRPISVKFAGATLGESIVGLQERTGINFVCDPVALGKFMPYLELRVSFEAEQIKPRTAMTLILRPFGLMAAEEGDHLLVTAHPPAGPGNRSLGSLDDELVRSWKHWQAARTAKVPAETAVAQAAGDFAEVEAAIAQVDAILIKVRDRRKGGTDAAIEKAGADREVKPAGGEERRGGPTHFEKISPPDYVVEPPDVLHLSVLEALPDRPIVGEYQVKPDGKISLGYYGTVFVAGLTECEIKEKVILHLRDFLTDDDLGLLKSNKATGKVEEVAPPDSGRVRVEASRKSNVYDVQGGVAKPGQFPITVSETVLDAINRAGGLAESSDLLNIRVVRPGQFGKLEEILPVDLKSIVEKGNASTNYQLMRGDRLVVYREPRASDPDVRLMELERKLELLLKKLDTPSKP